MKTIKLIFVGKPKYDGVESIVLLFKKRIDSYFKIEEFFLKELDFTKKKNIDYLIKNIKAVSSNKKTLLYIFTPYGKQFTSNEFSKILFSGFERFDSITLLVGGKEGIPGEIKKMGNTLISFSKMVFGHQIFRIMLYEQIYRAISIKYNLKYN